MTELIEGATAPVFDLPADSGKRVRLADLRGKSVVLFFYPKNDTPGCTLEAQQFAQLHNEFERANVVVLGISKCTVRKHDKFKEKFCLPFQLLSDDMQIAEAYGVWKEKSMYGRKYMGIERSTFLIDANGKLEKIWRKVAVEGHAAQVFAAVNRSS